MSIFWFLLDKWPFAQRSFTLQLVIANEFISASIIRLWHLHWNHSSLFLDFSISFFLLIIFRMVLFPLLQIFAPFALSCTTYWLNTIDWFDTWKQLLTICLSVSLTISAFYQSCLTPALFWQFKFFCHFIARIYIIFFPQRLWDFFFLIVTRLVITVVVIWPTFLNQREQKKTSTYSLWQPNWKHSFYTKWYCMTTEYIQLLSNLSVFLSSLRFKSLFECWLSIIFNF